MEERGREERKEEKEGMGEGACTHRNFRKSAPMMAPTEDRVARPERRWGCRRGTPLDS